MRILILAKRHYTNKDALAERFGRVYRLPLAWAAAGESVQLHLIDYRGHKHEHSRADGFDAASWPVRSPLALRRLAQSVAAYNPDILVAAGDNLVGLLGHRLARTAKARFVFDAYDDYREFGSSRLLLGWNAFDWLRLRADMTFYASEALAAGHPGSQSLRVVPNAVTPSEFRGLDRTLCRREAGLSAGGQWVGYFGSMEPDRGVGDLIEAIRRLRDSGRDVSLLLAGRRHPGTLVPDHPGVRYIGLVPHAQVPRLMAACDVLALPYRRSAIMDMGVSCKIGEYLFSARPIAATDTPNLSANFPEQAEILSQRLAKPGDAVDIARVIALQLDAPIVAPEPLHVTWEAVADGALAALRRLVAG